MPELEPTATRFNLPSRVRRTSAGDHQIDTRSASRLFTMRFRLGEFQNIYDNTREPDIAQAVSGTVPGNVSDYVRGACWLLDRLLMGPTRERVLEFLAIPEEIEEQATHALEFRFGVRWDREHPPVGPVESALALKNERELDALEARQAGVEPDAGRAPLEDPRPWNSEKIRDTEL